MSEEPSDSAGSEEWTLALRQLGSEPEAAHELLPAILKELRAVAGAYLGSGGASRTLQPTALVNETFLRLFGADAVASVRDRAHFFALAAKAMRQILVDQVRARQATKRGGQSGAAVTLGEDLGLPVLADEDLLDVDEALTELAELDEREARVVELRFFAGLDVNEVALAMDISVSTVEREWRSARAWLGRRLAGRESL